jgi:hypothetical protein
MNISDTRVESSITSANCIIGGRSSILPILLYLYSPTFAPITAALNSIVIVTRGHRQNLGNDKLTWAIGNMGIRVGRRTCWLLRETQKPRSVERSGV